MLYLRAKKKVNPLKDWWIGLKTGKDGKDYPPKSQDTVTQKHRISYVVRTCDVGST